MCLGWKNSPHLTDVDDSILVGVLSNTFKLSQKHLLYCKRQSLANFCLKEGRADKYHDSEKKILYQGANSQVPATYVHRAAPVNKATSRRGTRMPPPAAQASGLSQRLPGAGMGCRVGLSLFPHLGLLLGHHVQLLLAHPCLSLGRVEVVLLGPVRLLQPPVPLLSLLDEEAPQLLQVGQSLPDGLGVEAAVGDDVLAPLKDVVDARLVPLDLLLEGLCDWGTHTQSSLSLSSTLLVPGLEAEENLPVL